MCLSFVVVIDREQFFKVNSINSILINNWIGALHIWQKLVNQISVRMNRIFCTGNVSNEKAKCSLRSDEAILWLLNEIRFTQRKIKYQFLKWQCEFMLRNVHIWNIVKSTKHLILQTFYHTTVSTTFITCCNKQKEVHYK